MSKIVPSEQQPAEEITVDFDIKKFPSMSTIHWLRSFLIKKLPLELVDLVLDHAEYWSHTTTVSPRLGLVRTPVKWRDTSLDILSPSWPSPESQAMKEVLGFTLYSLPLASAETSLTPAAMLRKGLRRLVLKDTETIPPPRGQYPARMVVFEAVSQRHDILIGKFCDVGIIREVDQLLEQAVSVAGTQRRNSTVFSAFRGNARSSKPAKSDKTDQLIAQRECWFSTGANAGGKYVIKWRYDEDLNDGIEKDDDGKNLPTTAEFIKKLKIGDSIGLWAPVVRGNCVYRIEEVRVHVFWAV